MWRTHSCVPRRHSCRCAEYTLCPAKEHSEDKQTPPARGWNSSVPDGKRIIDNRMWRFAIGLGLSIPLLAQVDFATTIHPILVTRCAPCHSGPQAPAGFSVESRQAILSAIKPGKPGE